ncbi:hypothetical protein LXL04_038019 [Taraxacum kok-saghyz]
MGILKFAHPESDLRPCIFEIQPTVSRNQSSLRLESDSRQLNRFLTRIQTLTGITFKKVVKKLNFYTSPGYKGLIYSFKPSIMECKGKTVIGGYLEGQTIPNVGVYLSEPVFSHDQLYVALSRGISRGNTKVLVKSVEKSNVDEVYTSNVVYKEVLSD